MDPWFRFERAVLRRHGVADAELASRYGVAPRRFHARTRREGWPRPTSRVRLHPAAVRTIHQRVLVADRSTDARVAAAGATALWLLDIEERPPDVIETVQQHASQRPRLPHLVARRARWLTPDDVRTLDHVPVLTPVAALITTYAWSRERRRSWLVDAIHARLLAPEELLVRLDAIGPVPGRGQLGELASDLVGRCVESGFQEDVADDLREGGYHPDRSVRHIATPDGRGLLVDIALPAWQVAVEPEGDAYHRGREHRRSDRRRIAAYAGTDWVPVPVDWRDWQLDRGHVLRAIDDAIEAQRRRGIGASILPPRRAVG